MSEKVTLAELNIDVGPVLTAMNQYEQKVGTASQNVANITTKNAGAMAQAFQSFANKVKTAAGGAIASLQQVGTQTSTMGKIFSGVLSGLGIGVGFMGIQYVARELMAFGKSFVDAADSTERFEQRIKTLTGSMTTAGQVMETVNSISKNSPFSREQLEQAAVAIRKFGLSVMDTLPMVQDLAAATGMDLGGASELLGRALQGNVMALRMLQREAGISVQELDGIGINMAKIHRGGVLTADQVEKLGKLLKEHFGGGAADQMKTYAGQVQALKNEWDIFAESIGKLLVPALTMAVHWLSAGIEKLQAMGTVLREVHDAVAMLGQQLGYTSRGDTTGLFSVKPPSQDISTAPVRDQPRKVEGFDPAAEAAAQKQAQVNEQIETKIAEQHAATVESKIQDDLKEIETAKQGSSEQIAAIKQIRDLEQERAAAQRAAIDQTIAKLREQGANEELISKYKQEELDKIDQQNAKLEEQIKNIQERQVHEEEVKSAEKATQEAKKNALRDEENQIKSLNELLKQQKEHQKEITSAIQEQNKEIDEQKKKYDNALAEYQKGPLMSIQDLQKELQTGTFGTRTFRPVQEGVESIQDIVARRAQQKAAEAAAHPELGEAEADIAATQAKLTAAEATKQQIQDIDIHIDGSTLKGDAELGKKVNDILNDIMKKSGNQANWQPQDKTIF